MTRSICQTENMIHRAIALAAIGERPLIACLPDRRKAIAKRVKELGATAQLVERGVFVTRRTRESRRG